MKILKKSQVLFANTLSMCDLTARDTRNIDKAVANL